MRAISNWQTLTYFFRSRRLGSLPNLITIRLSYQLLDQSFFLERNYWRGKNNNQNLLWSLLPLIHVNKTDLVPQDNVISYLYPILITDILTLGKFERKKRTEITMLEFLILCHHQGTDKSVSLYFSIAKYY
jgi:hypothetical protein